MAQTFGLDQAQFNTIISATHTAIDQMQSSSNQVGSTAGDILTHNQSQSGVNTNQHLTQWQEDFAQIVRAITDLNERALSLYKLQGGVSSDTADATRAN